MASSHNIEDVDQRLEGYRDALKANSINLSNSYIEYGSPDSDGGEKAMTNLLTKSLPISAVVAYNDNMAAGALSVLEENQYRLPNQMSMIGFDDGLIAKYLHPKLTTIRYPVEMMAEKAAQIALSLSKNDEIDKEPMVYSPTLVQRSSVAKA